MAVVLSTTSVAAAQTLAAGVSVLAAGWPVDPALASAFAGPPAVGPDGMIGATPGAAPGNGPAQAGSWSAGTGAGLAAAGSGLAGVSASLVGAVSETTADLGDIAFGLNGSDAASVRLRGGSSFALLARGGRGAPARVLAHCRSVPPRVGSRGPSAGAGSGERLSAMRELGG
jgi:hypothetical protein